MGITEMCQFVYQVRSKFCVKDDINDMHGIINIPTSLNHGVSECLFYPRHYPACLCHS